MRAETYDKLVFLRILDVTPTAKAAMAPQIETFFSSCVRSLVITPFDSGGESWTNPPDSDSRSESGCSKFDQPATQYWKPGAPGSTVKLRPNLRPSIGSDDGNQVLRVRPNLRPSIGNQVRRVRLSLRLRQPGGQRVNFVRRIVQRSGIRRHRCLTSPLPTATSRYLCRTTTGAASVTLATVAAT